MQSFSIENVTILFELWQLLEFLSTQITDNEGVSEIIYFFNYLLSGEIPLQTIPVKNGCHICK